MVGLSTTTYNPINHHHRPNKMAQLYNFQPNPQGLPFTSITVMFCRTCGAEELHMTHQEERHTLGEDEVSTAIIHYAYSLCFDCYIEDV